MTQLMECKPKPRIQKRDVIPNVTQQRREYLQKYVQSISHIQQSVSSYQYVSSQQKLESPTKSQVVENNTSK